MHCLQSSVFCADDVLSTLESVQGRKHPNNAQARQLKSSLSLLPVIVHVVSSAIFRTQVVTKGFAQRLVQLIRYSVSVAMEDTSIELVIGESFSTPGVSIYCYNKSVPKCFFKRCHVSMFYCYCQVSPVYSSTQLTVFVLVMKTMLILKALHHFKCMKLLP